MFVVPLEDNLIFQVISIAKKYKEAKTGVNGRQFSQITVIKTVHFKVMLYNQTTAEKRRRTSVSATPPDLRFCTVNGQESSQCREQSWEENRAGWERRWAVCDTDVLKVMWDVRYLGMVTSKNVYGGDSEGIKKMIHDLSFSVRRRICLALFV